MQRQRRRVLDATDRVALSLTAQQGPTDALQRIADALRGALGIDLGDLSEVDSPAGFAHLVEVAAANHGRGRRRRQAELDELRDQQDDNAGSFADLAAAPEPPEYPIE